jgi:serine/threonine protein kinase
MNDPVQPQSSHPRVQEALAEYRRRIADGEQIDEREFLARHPDISQALRSYFNSTDSAAETIAPASTHRARRDGPEQESRSSPGPATLAGADLPEQFGRYRVQKCLGRGSMGAVYLAVDTQLDRPVALKIPKFAADCSPELLSRFHREAKAAATLRSANICPVHDVGQIDGVHYISMAYIEGQSLADLIAGQGAWASADAARLVRKIALALSEAHSKRIVHRDLKPSNIIIDDRNEPIIMDFGVACRAETDEARLTHDGAIVGSPAYMSPEQLEGSLENVGPACDVYSLGVMLYELLTGRLPFQGSMAAIIGQIIMKEPKKPSAIRPDIDPRLEAICLMMMAKKPEHRFASMHAVPCAARRKRPPAGILRLPGRRLRPPGRCLPG